MLVSTSPCFYVLCAVFVALRAHNGQKLAFDGALGQYFRGDAAEEAVPGEFVVPCTWQPAHLLAALTLQCAAKPYWWHGGQPAQATTYRASVRRKRPRPPPHGLTCASKGPRAQDAFTGTEEGLTAHRRPDAPHASPETTEAGPRRVLPLVACGGRAVGAEKSPYQQHVVSYNPLITPNTGQLPHQGSRRIRKPPRFEGSAGVMRGDGGI